MTPTARTTLISLLEGVVRRGFVGLASNAILNALTKRVAARVRAVVIFSYFISRRSVTAFSRRVDGVALCRGDDALLPMQADARLTTADAGRSSRGLTARRYVSSAPMADVFLGGVLAAVTVL